MKLGLHQLARREHGSYSLCWQRFTMDRSKPTQPHQLRDASDIFTIGLDRHGFEGVAHVARLKQLDGEAGFGQTGIKPLRKGAASKPILDSDRPRFENQTMNASGSLATIASQTIKPSTSTTRTLDCSNETSMSQ
jgi:hypothetical protein